MLVDRAKKNKKALYPELSKLEKSEIVPSEVIKLFEENNTDPSKDHFLGVKENADNSYSLVLVPAAEIPFARYPKAAQEQLLLNLTALKLHAQAPENWHKAMVTHGGIALEEVNFRTLESKIVKGLYFAGEVLDIDGPCGGYNISWALASGFTAGGMTEKYS